MSYQVVGWGQGRLQRDGGYRRRAKVNLEIADLDEATLHADILAGISGISEAEVHCNERDRTVARAYINHDGDVHVHVLTDGWQEEAEAHRRRALRSFSNYTYTAR